MSRICVLLGMGIRIFREICVSWTFFRIRGPRSKSNWAILDLLFSKGQLRPYYAVSHWGLYGDESGEIGHQNVDNIHLCFNWTGIWGGETMYCTYRTNSNHLGIIYILKKNELPGKKMLKNYL